MTTVYTILTVLVVIASILLTIVVLLQNGKGEGLASNFVAGNQAFGVRQTADILEKITWGLVTFILVVSIISSFTLRTGRSDEASDLKEKVMETNVPTPALPTAPAAEIPADVPAEPAN